MHVHLTVAPSSLVLLAAGSCQEAEQPTQHARVLRTQLTFSHSFLLPFPCCLQKLCKELEELNKQRASLEAKVSQLAQAGGDLAALEAASTQLAAVADKADGAELQWLELAELAGDL
jgi:hypothetical protein